VSGAALYLDELAAKCAFQAAWIMPDGAPLGQPRASLSQGCPSFRFSSEKDAKLGQKLGQLQPFYSCTPTGTSMGQRVYFAPP
jgi:hypothetical protein